MAILNILVFALALHFSAMVLAHSRIPAFPTEYPKKIQDVQSIVWKAMKLRTTVKAFGSRHSVLDTICTDGIPIDMHNINYTIFNYSTNKVTVGAGAELTDFITFLQSKGRSLSGHTPSYGGVTVGGVLGTGARGSSLIHPATFSDQIISVRIVNGTGGIQIIDDSNPEFAAFRVHLGLLGIIIDATFNTVPAYKMKMHNHLAKDTMLTDGTFLKMARKFDWLQAWWFPSFSNVVVSKGSNVNFNTFGNASTYMITDVDLLTVTALREAFELGQAHRSQLVLNSIQLWSELSLFSQVPLRQPVFSEDGETLTNPAVGYVHNLMQNRCKKCPWMYGPDKSLFQGEFAFAVPLTNFKTMIQTIRNILQKTSASFPVYGIFLRFSPSSQGLMSVEYGRETVHVEIVTPARVNPFTTARAGLAAVQAIEQSLMFNLGGRPHWSMCGQALHTLALLERTAPNIEQFRRYVNKYDPNGVFMNNFGKRIMGVADVPTVDPRTIHCALQENCFCKKNSDCAVGQVCSKLNGFNVCKDGSLFVEKGIISGLAGGLTKTLITFIKSIKV